MQANQKNHTIFARVHPMLTDLFQIISRILLSDVPSHAYIQQNIELYNPNL